VRSNSERAGILCLSHFINSETPLYGGEKLILISINKSIKKGDSCNTKTITIPNHTGTHIDFPNHFSNEGKTINDYSPKFWIFQHLFILNYTPEPAEIIDLCDRVDEIPSDTDFLILKTGFQQHRKSDTYWQLNPGLSPKLAGKLRQRCPNLRVTGFDFISLSSYQNREIGREAHREFLIKHDILIIEDMDLSRVNGHIAKLICLPLLIDGIDGVPVTIIAELANVNS